jgi:predicted ATPase/class 3 adenylate cyclase/Tfp pilus assembly protein PilF
MSNEPLPAGTLTFLFTDIEGSTRIWERHPGRMPAALARHDALLRSVVARERGRVFKEVGDAVCAVFGAASEALAAALAAQRALAAEAWDVPGGLRVRMAVHSGAAEVRDEDYYGTTLNRTARILAAGHGGQVLVSQAARELARDRLPEGVGLRDLGEFRLKDLTRSERIFQLDAPGLESDFPRLRTLEGRAHNLPVQPTPLVGREPELAAIRSRLLDEDVRLLTLTGPGGSGKTRLALQAAADLLDDFEHGVTAVFLAPLRDAALVVPTIAGALGLRESGLRPLSEALVEYLQGRRTLLVLDNFEQVVAAALETTSLLAACPAVKVLVTSREALRVSGEHELPIPPLGFPGGGRAPILDELAAYPAVTLFVQRARAVQPAFALTADNAAAVAEICRKLDGLPLAIELAAARVKLLPPRALSERLASRLDLLSRGPRDAPARQRTLRGAIDWSHDLLAKSERALFRRLAAFVSGVSLEAAEVVCGPVVERSGAAVDVLDTLESLANKSLLRPVETEDGEPRLAMLETIREYARERLVESGEADVIWRRHADYFRALAERTEPMFRGGQQPAAVALVGREHENLRAAMTRSLERGEVETAARTAGAIWWFWWVHGHLREGRDWLEKVLAAGETLADGLRAKLLNSLGGIAYQQGDWARAVAALEEGLALARRAANPDELGRALSNLGMVLSESGDPARAEALFEEALDLDRALGDRRGIAYTLGSLAVMATYRGEYARARPLYEESLALHRELGDVHSVAITLNNIGDMARMEHELDRAEGFYRQSLELVGTIEGRHIQAHVISNLGDVAQDRGDLKGARALYLESLQLARELGQRREIAITLAALAGVEVAEGRMDRAAAFHGAVSRMREANPFRLMPAEQRRFDAIETAIRATRGEDALARATVHEAGLTVEEAAALALEEAP